MSVTASIGAKQLRLKLGSAKKEAGAAKQAVPSQVRGFAIVSNAEHLAHVPRGAGIILTGSCVLAAMDEPQKADGFRPQPARKTVLRRVSGESGSITFQVSEDIAAALKPFGRRPIALAHDCYLEWALRRRSALLVAVHCGRGEDHSWLSEWLVTEGRLEGYREKRMPAPGRRGFNAELNGALQEARTTITDGRPMYLSGEGLEDFAANAGYDFIGQQPLWKPVSKPLDLGYHAWNPLTELAIPAAIAMVGVAAFIGVIASGERALERSQGRYRQIEASVEATSSQGNKELALLNAQSSYLAENPSSKPLALTLRNVVEGVATIQGALLMEAIVRPIEDDKTKVEFIVKLAFQPDEAKSLIAQAEEPMRQLSTALGVPVSLERPQVEPILHISRTHLFRSYTVRGALPARS